MRSLVFLIPIIFISSCSYESYSECMTKEIQKNNGNGNMYITSYCKELFPIPPKEKKQTPKDINMLIEGIEYELVFNDQGRGVIRNLTNTKTVYSLQKYEYGDYRLVDGQRVLTPNQDERCSKTPKIVLNNSPNVLSSPVEPRQTSDSFYRDTRYSCMIHVVKGKKN